MSIMEQSADSPAWYAEDPEAALAALSVDPDPGLDAAEAQRRLAEYGPNQLATEPPPSIWSVALGQLSNPMNIMLADRRGRESRDRAGRDGHLRRAAGDVQRRHGLAAGAQGAGERRSTGATPGAPCSGAARGSRRGRSSRSTLSRATSCCWRRATSCPPTAESSCRRPSRCRRPRSRARARRSRRTRTTLPEGDIALGDRTNMVFQNTQVTRGTATLRRDRHRSGHADGSHRRHGHRDPARAVTVAASSSTA